MIKKTCTPRIKMHPCPDTSKIASTEEGKISLKQDGKEKKAPERSPPPYLKRSPVHALRKRCSVVTNFFGKNGKE